MKAIGVKPAALVIDDEQSICELLELLLEENGFDVDCALDIASAKKLIDKRTYDLAVVDKNLPDGNGLDLIRSLRNVSPDTACVMITGYANVESAVEALRLGVGDYIEKPLPSIDRVQLVIERVLKLSALERENRRLIEDLQRKNATLEALAVRDPLTQLYNHGYMQDIVVREIVRCKRHDVCCSLLFIDLDGFKQVNDTHGHLAGDRLLKLVSKLLSGDGRRTDVNFRLRAEDVVARYGGDEFAVLLPETPKEGATVKAERLRQSIEDFDFGAHDLPELTMSIGVATFPVDGPDRGAIVNAADIALYAAKHGGRNRVVGYYDSLAGLRDQDTEVAATEVRQHGALERSIKELAFHFRYQPIVNTDTREVLAYEALCRPTDPEFPHPGVLIETAQRVGRVIALGRALRQKVASSIPELPAEAMLFINLHPHEIYDPEFIATEPILVEHASRIVFEITEVAAIKDFGRIRDITTLLRERGFRIALDDLGAGYSQLNSLTLLRPDYVKLDMTLVRSLPLDARTRRLVRHILEFTRDEGMVAVGEGVETEEERQILADLECPLIQGYLVAKPLLIGEIKAK